MVDEDEESLDVDSSSVVVLGAGWVIGADVGAVAVVATGIVCACVGVKTGMVGAAGGAATEGDGLVCARVGVKTGMVGGAGGAATEGDGLVCA